MKRNVEKKMKKARPKKYLEKKDRTQEKTK